MKDVEFSPRARRDLEDIWDFTADRWDDEQADRCIRGIVMACDEIARGARLGRSAAEIRPEYLRYTYQSHVIFYKESVTLLDVVRVLHTRMDFDEHLPD